MSAAIVAFGAVSALGEGGEAVSAGEPGAVARVAIARDAELVRAGLARPFAARALVLPGATDRATSLLTRAALACAASLDAAMPAWRALRVGLAVGTSSGGLGSAEALFPLARRGALDHVPVPRVSGALYGGPLLAAAGALAIPLGPAALVLGACSASTLAIGLATRWLEDGLCDVVLAGGFDAVTVLVAAGFEALRATTSEPPPRPFRLGRDGMALGEGAALLALAPSEAAPGARAFVSGFGASSDAVHLTAPDRTGGGLARAASLALEEAGRPDVDIVSAHATATPFSDAAEARAIRAALGEDGAARAVVHPFKAQAGHTLGAAGALETLVCADALTRGILPAAAGEGAMDPDAPARLLARAQRGEPRTALKLSAAFGGANAALVISTTPGSPARRARRSVLVGRAEHVDREPAPAALAAELGQPLERIARADVLLRFALAAVARLERRRSLRGAGIVVGAALGTLETDALFHARIEARGARSAEPRRFPYTSPNAAAGECGVVFGLTGPGFAVGSGPAAGLEALLVARDLVRGGDAERVVVVAVDHVGAFAGRVASRIGLNAPSGAVAVLVSSAAEGPSWELSEGRVDIAPWPPRPGEAAGLAALLPLVDPPSEDLVLEAGGSPPGDPGAWSARARVHLAPFR